MPAVVSFSRGLYRHVEKAVVIAVAEFFPFEKKQVVSVIQNAASLLVLHSGPLKPLLVEKNWYLGLFCFWYL